MKLKTAIACGMLLGLLSGVGFAQRMHLGSGGTVPGARMPAAHPLGHIGDAHSGLPNSTVAPNAHTTAANPSSIKSSTDPAAQTVKPNASTVPDRTTVPDANATGGRINAGPIQ